MKNQLCFTPISGIETELLAVPAADMQVSQESGAKAVPVLLTADEKVKAAAADVLASGGVQGRDQ